MITDAQAIAALIRSMLQAWEGYATQAQGELFEDEKIYRDEILHAVDLLEQMDWS